NNNIEHQGIEFWNDTMRPYSSLWASSINCFLLGEDSDLQPVFDMSEVLMGDSQSRARYWSTMTTSGILTRNEGREAENYDPLDGLDEPLQPMN
ncbi:phage portal protein, partial [Klebsiella sp. MC1F]|uniref:phage portal protein n=1 Tax=Klebsiella sp. MC1F TaxID=2831023 RepID=UPI001BA8085B